MPKRDYVDLTADEVTESVLPINKSLGRVSEGQPAYGGKQMSRSRTAQHPMRTRTPQTPSQWSAPGLARDKSPPRTSKTTNDTSLSNNDPGVSRTLSAKSPAGIFDRDRDGGRNTT